MEDIVDGKKTLFLKFAKYQDVFIGNKYIIASCLCEFTLTLLVC